MRLLKTVFIVLVFFCFNSVVAQEFSLEHQQSIPVETENYLFGVISLMEKTEQHLFLIDGSQHNVFVFDKKTLTFQSSWGQAGRGPGDFNQIFATDSKDNKLYILDRMLIRVTSYNPENDEIEVFQIRKPDVNTTGIGFLDDGNILLVNGGYPDPKTEPIIHINDFENDKPVPLPIYASELFDLTVPIENRFGHSLGFRLDRIGNSDRFLLSNRVFKGALYEVLPNEEKLTLFSKVDVPEPAYAIYDADSGLELRQSGMPGLVISSGRTGRFVYQMLSNSLAISSNDQFVIHLRSVNREMDTIYFLDIHGHNGDLFQTLNITNYLQTAQYVTDILLLSDNSMLISFVDDEDGYPKVEIFQLEQK